MVHRIGPGWASLVLLLVTLCMTLDHAAGQQVCVQTTPGSCPAGYHCGASSTCVKTYSQDGSGANTTTYIIIGTVLAGIIIIVAVILILYCGKWTWVQRLRERVNGEVTSKQQLPPMVPPPPSPSGPLIYKAPQSGSTWQRFKLRLGGARQTPFTTSPSPFVSPALAFAPPSPVMTVPAPQPAVRAPSPVIETPASPSLLGLSGYNIPTQQNMLGSQATYVIAQGAQPQTADNRQGYVATVNVDSPLPAIEYPSNAPRVGQQVVQVGGVVQPSFSQEPTLRPPSPQYQPQINIHAPQPTTQQYQPVMPQVFTHSHPIHPPVHHTHEGNTIGHSHEMPPIQHSHQVFPSVYPSLESVQGSTHPQCPPSYIDVPRKY